MPSPRAIVSAKSQSTEKGRFPSASASEHFVHVRPEAVSIGGFPVIQVAKSLQILGSPQPSPLEDHLF